MKYYAFFWIEYTIFCIEFQYFGMHGKKWICLSFFWESSYPFLIVLVKISIILERGTFLVYFAKILAILERETTLLFCLKISAILERGTYVLKSGFFDTTSAKLRSVTLVLSWNKTDFIKILLFRLDFSKSGLKLGNFNFPSFFYCVLNKSWFNFILWIKFNNCQTVCPFLTTINEDIIKIIH